MSVSSIADRESAARERLAVLLTPHALTWKQAVAALLISLALLVPCVWHPRIEAGDLASHTYNAWLTTLVKQGKAPGLWIAPQHNNVLFDALLFRLCSVFGFTVGERIAVALAVLIFFWSAFALCSAINKHPTWFLVPILAMLSYGYTIEMGFLNFYLSLALSFVALLIIWTTSGARLFWALAFVPLIWIAHPLGLAWFFGCATFVVISKKVAARWQWISTLVTLGLLVCCRLFLASHYPAIWTSPWYRLNGTDQLVLGWRYRFLPYAILGSIIACVLLDFLRRPAKSEPLKANWLAIQLWIVVLAGVMLLPDGLMFPSYAVPVLFINTRFTLAAGILACCVLGTLKPLSRVILGCLTGGVAVTFFWLLFLDTGHEYSMEREAQALVQHVPQDGRVISTLFPLRSARVLSHHVAARACIGHCFLLDNYEASTKQFRLRANAGNRIVSDDARSADEMISGTYVVKPEDLPVWHLFQCGPSEIDLCLRPLKPGPLNGVPAQK